MSHIFTAGARQNVATRFLSDDEIRRVAPSVFAEQPHSSRSDRYAYIPTSAVVAGLRAEGFEPVKVTTSRTRDESKRGFEKHMIRFRRSDAGQVVVGDVFPEVVLVNSHDGSTSYNLMAGLFRLACSNGLVVPQEELTQTRIRHTGERIVDDVIEGSYRVLGESETAIETAKEWGMIELDPREQQALAIGAHHLRFADAAGNVETPIKADQFLNPRRLDDRKNDLWTVFNRVQENAIKGGLRGIGVGSNGRRRRTTTKEVKGIDGNVNLNKALWKMAEHLAGNRA